MFYVSHELLYPLPRVYMKDYGQMLHPPGFELTLLDNPFMEWRSKAPVDNPACSYH